MAFGFFKRAAEAIGGLFGFGGAQRTGEWPEAVRKMQMMGMRVRNAQKKSVEAVAKKMAEEMKETITMGGRPGNRFQALSPITIMISNLMGGRINGPLLETATMRNSITYVVRSDNKEAFVGVPGGIFHPRTGADMAEVAEIHEFGTGPRTVVITDLMRAYFFWLSKQSGGRIKPLSPATTTISYPGIPARPFVRPTIDAVQSKLNEQVESEFVRNEVL